VRQGLSLTTRAPHKSLRPALRKSNTAVVEHRIDHLNGARLAEIPHWYTNASILTVVHVASRTLDLQSLRSRTTTKIHASTPQRRCSITQSTISSFREHKHSTRKRIYAFRQISHRQSRTHISENPPTRPYLHLRTDGGNTKIQAQLSGKPPSSANLHLSKIR
jgi:hypothetical protein